MNTPTLWVANISAWRRSVFLSSKLTNLLNMCLEFPVHSPYILFGQTHTHTHTHHTHIHTHSNPQVQQEVLQYGGLSLLCQLISSSEPEMVQRRSLFAVSALLRGNLQDQQVSVAVSYIYTHHQGSYVYTV